MMAVARSDMSPRAVAKDHLRRSERSLTPVSITSSSSEEDLSVSPLDSYDVIRKKNLVPKRYYMKGKDRIPLSHPDVLPDLEIQAKTAAESLTKMMTTLSKDLKYASSITLETVQVYETCVDDVGAALDESMRTMYALMAKVEELDRKMQPVYKIAEQVQEIKTLLDSFESLCK